MNRANDLGEEHEVLNCQKLLPALTVILGVAGEAVRLCYLNHWKATIVNLSARLPVPLRIALLQVDNDLLKSYFAAPACISSQDTGRSPEQGSCQIRAASD